MEWRGAKIKPLQCEIDSGLSNLRNETCILQIHSEAVTYQKTFLLPILCEFLELTVEW